MTARDALIERSWPGKRHGWACEKDAERPCTCGLDAALTCPRCHQATCPTPGACDPRALYR